MHEALPVGSGIERRISRVRSTLGPRSMLTHPGFIFGPQPILSLSPELWVYWRDFLTPRLCCQRIRSSWTKRRTASPIPRGSLCLMAALMPEIIEDISHTYYQKSLEHKPTGTSLRTHTPCRRCSASLAAARLSAD